MSEAVIERLRASAGALRGTRWSDRVRVLGRIGARLMDPEDPARRRALAELPADARMSPMQAERILDGMARDWTAPRLETLVRVEFDDPAALDGWVDDPRAPEGRRLRALPLAPGPSLHIGAGSVPGVSVTSAVRALLVGAPALLKPGRGDRVLPRVFADTLAEEGEFETTARILSEALAIGVWRGGEGGDDEVAALEKAGFVVVYGGTETVSSVRRSVPASTPIVEYGHRMGIAAVGPYASEAETAGPLAAAVAVFDQRGCVSPQQIFVVGGAERAEAFAAAVAEALEGLEQAFPSLDLDDATAGAVRQLRDATELRGLSGDGARAWGGERLTWTVVLEPRPLPMPSCGGRTVHVTPVESIADLERALGPLAPFLQTVAVDGFGDPIPLEVAERLARVGASRLVPAERVSFPPPWWTHDGHGPLRRLIRWCAEGPV